MSTALSHGCLIISGTPGAGKTTVARRVAETLPRAAHIGGDEVNLMIVSGAVGPVSEPRVESLRQLELRARNICSLADNFADFGFTPVIDHVVPDRKVLELMVELLSPMPVFFVTLAPSIEAARERNLQRPEIEQVPFDFSELRHGMERELANLGWWFDTSDVGIDDVVSRVLSETVQRGCITPSSLEL